MKKVLALVLAVVMALSLATVASAAITMTPNDETFPVDAQPEAMFFGGKTIEIPVEPSADYEAITEVDGAGTGVDLVGFLTKSVSDDAEPVTSEYSLSYSASSANTKLLNASITTKNMKGTATGFTSVEGKALYLKLDPADEFFTVEDHKVEVKVVVVQKEKASGTTTVKAEVKFNVVLSNEQHVEGDFWTTADDKVESLKGLSLPVIDDEVFTGIAKDKSLTLDYSKYTVKFAKVSKQNTALYLKANTDVTSGSKAIASIGFKPTRVKDAATITMPINPDNQNLYGETVYVYSVVDGKPTGNAIAAEVVNHNSVIFTVPAGTTLGTFAAYGAQAEGDAEKPAIPETGANDIVNIAIVFAVVALAAAGFVAVKKASK